MQEEDKAVILLLCPYPRAAKGSRGRSVFLDREACPAFQDLLDFLVFPDQQVLPDHQGNQEPQEMREILGLRGLRDPEEHLAARDLPALLVHQGLWDRLVPTLREVGKLVLLPVLLDHGEPLEYQE
ncbi:hypothetical protein LDENG_00232310 [Lucifuga dentata]|nr:hypothetical protein LDENG_00232310 [Lucifuga dentata]